MRNKKSMQDFIEYGNTISQKGLSWGASGNMSMRIDAKRCLVTGTGSRFDALSSQSIATVSLVTGHHLTRVKPSVESRMHTGILQVRPDVEVIIHVHPFYSVLMISAQNVEINTAIIPEAKHYLGAISFVPYIQTGSQALAEEAAKAAAHADLIVLRSHGIVCLGKTFHEALGRAEAFEFIAHLTYAAHAADLSMPVVPS